ncbi:Protein of unknown function [Propionibacterium freudenreichii subsp. freudenreichii]|jgi:hypothetical protein|eukprot:gene21154-27408_t
MLR